MHNGVTIFYDGEIFSVDNKYKHLKGTNESVIQVIYQNEGAGVGNYLNGSFILLILDSDREEILIIRDKAGGKSFFYSTQGGYLTIASSIRGILCSHTYSRDIDWNGLWQNLSFPAPPQPITCFKDIQALPRGYFLKLTRTQDLSIHRYWEIPVGGQNPGLNLKEGAEIVHNAMSNAIQRQTQGDVSIGSLISGGVDSPYITALAALELPGMKAFTFALDSNQFANRNEDTKAALTANRYNIHHIVKRYTLNDLLEDFDQIIELYEQPGSNFAPYYWTAKMAKEEGVRILLNGLAADELHGGFQYFKYFWIWHLIKKIKPLVRFIPRGKSKKWEDLRNLSLANTIDEYYTHAFSTFKEFEKRQLLPHFSNFNSYETIRQIYGTKRFNDDTEGLVYYMFSNCPNHHLYRMDQFSRHFGIEARYPFLDMDSINAALQLPSNLKVRRDERKIALKEAARPYIPAESLGKVKLGLNLPIGYWLNNDLKSFTDSKLDNLKLRSEFSSKAIDYYVERYKRSIPGKVWKLVMIELWFEKFID